MRVRFLAIVVLVLIMGAVFWKFRATPPAPSVQVMAKKELPLPIPTILKSEPLHKAPIPEVKHHAVHKALVLPVAPTQPKIPLIPTTPIVVHRPAPIPPPPAEPQEWKGNNDTSVTHPGQIVIQTDKQWVHFWAEHHPGEAAPDVDFTRSMVVGVFLGVRPSDGFFVTIKDTRTLADKLMVDYIQVEPPTGTLQFGVTAYPYDIQVIPRSQLHVQFNRLTPQT